MNMARPLSEWCTFERGISPTLKTNPGEYPLVVTAEKRRTADSWQINGPAVCIPLISSTGHGHASLHRVHYQEGPFALANLLVALKPRDPKRCNAKYLYYWLQSHKDAVLVPLMTGTANVALKETDVASVKVPLPPIEEQLTTIARLETMGERVQSLNDIVNTASEKGRQLIASAFADITQGASYSPIALVAPIVRRKVELRAESEYPELGIRSFGKGTFHKPPIKGIDLGGKKLFQILPGDVVFNNVFAWEGAVAVVGPEDHGRFGSHRFITCVPRKEMMTAEYLAFYFNTTEGLEKLGKASPGGAGRNRTLGLESLAQIEVPVPLFNKQEWFGELLGKVEHMQRIRARTQSAIRELAPALWSSVLRPKNDVNR